MKRLLTILLASAFPARGSSEVMGLPDTERFSSEAGKSTSMASSKLVLACKLSSMARLATGPRLLMRLRDTSKYQSEGLEPSGSRLAMRLPASDT